VLVVGGGPAGAATAAFAARSGLRVIVVDRAVFPREKPCAEYLSPEAGRDLEALGVLDELLASGAERLTGMRIVSDDGAAVTGRFAAAEGFPPFRPWGLAVRRTVLDPALLRAAARAGAEVREGAALEDLVLEAGAVRGGVVRDRSGTRTVRARVVVGADGLNSRVARRLALARRGRPWRLALTAHVAGVRDLTDCGEMCCGRGWYVGVAHLGGGVASVAMVVPWADRAAIAADAPGYFLRRLAGHPALAARVRDARIVRRILAAGPFARSPRGVTAAGALLVGDAAGFFDPFTGEGVFAALRGGRLAAETLASALGGTDGPGARALAPYAAARRRAFHDKAVLERVVGLSATRPAVMRRFTGRLGRRPGVADLWVGAAGDTVPVRALFAPRHLAALLF